MYGRERRVLLRHYLEQGLAKAEIARTLNVSRRTVYHWLATGHLERELDNEAVQYRPRAAVARKIDPYREIILARLAAYPRLSATRLHDEIRAAGYAGGYTQVKEYVRQVRPKPPADPVVRFETPAGLQAQVDFAEFRLPWGKRFALLVVLGYSRLLWLQFYSRQTMTVLMRGLEQAFAAFGGVPVELLFDQLKTAIIDDERASGGKLLENLEFARFAAHWGFRIRACRPYRARTKGKVVFAVGSTLYSYLFLLARSIPVPLAWLGILASVLLVVGRPTQLSGFLKGPVTSWMWLPIMVFEVTLGLLATHQGCSCASGSSSHARQS
jgi:transposase